jgi:hypothetical protein
VNTSLEQTSMQRPQLVQLPDRMTGEAPFWRPLSGMLDDLLFGADHEAVEAVVAGITLARLDTRTRLKRPSRL